MGCYKGYYTAKSRVNYGAEGFGGLGFDTGYRFGIIINFPGCFIWSPQTTLGL